MPLITPANAAELGRRSAAIVKARKEAARLAKINEPQTVAPVVATDDYVSKRLARVRAIQDRIDAKALVEDDPQALSWLATAAARWSEQEFDLAGRPKPGNRRPGPERSAKAGVFWGTSAPVQQPQEAPKPAFSPESPQLTQTPTLAPENRG
jgi:hypothetical protein